MDTANTFAATQGAQPFDWNEFLADQRTDEEWESAYSLSADWVTCACGNLCDALPRRGDKSPEDQTLYWLGNYFHSAIAEHDAAEAHEVLGKIEARAAYLLANLPAPPAPPIT